MNLHDDVAVLLAVPPFTALDASKLKLLAFASQRLNYLPGERLIMQGDPGDAVHVILDGEVEVSIASGTGERVVRRMGRHAFFGEIAILEHVARTATVTAITAVDALRIERDTLLRLMQDLPAFGEAIEAHMANSGYVYE